MTSWVGPPAGTITHTTVGDGSASTSSGRLFTSEISRSWSRPTTVWPALRRRVRMLPPILPSPTRPSSMLILRCGGRFRRSGEQAARHEQVAERRVAGPITGVLTDRTTDDDRFGSLREGQLHDGLVDGGQAVEEELGVEARGQVVALDGGLDRLRGLRLVAGAGVEGQHPVGEGELDRGV